MRQNRIQYGVVNKKYNGVGLLILISSILLNLFFLTKEATKKSDEGLLIVDVIDGDTIVTEDKVRVRLTAVDAPEINLCNGEESKNTLEELVLNKRVEIKSPAADGFGRLVGLVYVGEKLINEEVLRLGMGRFGGGNSAKREVLRAAADEARAKMVGIYDEKCYQLENKENPGCLIKGNRDKRNLKKGTYHFPGCSGYNVVVVEKDLGDEWFCSEEEAVKAGFVKSINCYEKAYEVAI